MPIFKPPKTGGAPDTPSTGSGGIGGTLGDEPPPYRPPNEPDCVETSSCSNSNGKGDKEPPEIPDVGGGDDDSSSSSSSSSNQPAYIGAGPAWNTTGGSDYSSPSADSSSQGASTNNAALPIWAIALIIVASVICLVFLVSLWVFCARERQKRYERNKSPSYRRALRRAFAAATGAFIPIWIVKKCWSKPRQSDDDYAKLEAYLKYGDIQPTTTTAYVSPVKVQRASSIVSSLSSHSASQGRYERLQPSPMSERASIASSPLQRPPEVQVRDHDISGDAGGSVHTSLGTDPGRETAAGEVLSENRSENRSRLEQT